MLTPSLCQTMIDVNKCQIKGKIQTEMAQGTFDMNRLKWAGVDLLAARRGEGNPEAARRFGLDRPAHVSHADFILNRMVQDQVRGYSTRMPHSFARGIPDRYGGGHRRPSTASLNLPSCQELESRMARVQLWLRCRRCDRISS